MFHAYQPHKIRELRVTTKKLQSVMTSGTNTGTFVGERGATRVQIGIRATGGITGMAPINPSFNWPTSAAQPLSIIPRQEIE